MGYVTATSGAQTLTWETYDFSLGAFDASASIRRSDAGITLNIRAFDPEDEGLDGAFRIDIEAILASLNAGPGSVTLIEVVDQDRFAEDSARYRGTSDVSLAVTALTRDGEDSYGQISGTFAGSFCRATSEQAAIDTEDCRDVTGQFDTMVQFEGI